MNRLRHPFRITVLFVTLLGCLLGGLSILGATPAHALVIGPGHVAVRGFSGFVARDGGELGAGLLANGVVGVCLDTGPGYRWPAGTPSARLVVDPRPAWLATTYLPRARHDAVVAAALWWALGAAGDGLGLNAHPAAVRQHVGELHAESPGVYARVKRWHDTMLRRARRYAPGRHGYRAATPHLSRTKATRLGVRSAAGHWVPGARLTVRVTGATFAGGAHTRHLHTTTHAVALRLTHATGAVRLRVKVAGLPGPAYRLYDAGGSTQRIAAAAPTRTVRAQARLAAPSRPVKPHAAPPVPLTITKTAETDDPAGMVGVAVEVHQGGAAGPVVDNHTFTTADLVGTHVSYTFGAHFDPQATYTVVISGEPDGWLPVASAVTATHGTAGFTAALADQKIWQPLLSTTVARAVVGPGATLTDAVRVQDTGGHTLVGHWLLLGPVAPVATGCAHDSWAGAPTAGSGTFRVAGDGRYTVGAIAVRTTGCYTYREALDATPTTRAVGWTTPGAVAETTLVRSAPTLHTQASAAKATVGATLTDTVAVSGLAAGSGSMPATASWRLLGPVAPHGTSCAHRSWGKAAVAAHGTTRIARDGSVRLGAHKLTAGGCYTYVEALAATTTSAAVAWTKPGIAAETTVVAPRKARVPSHPQVPAGDAVPRTSTAATHGEVRIAKAGFDAKLLSASFHGDALTPPADLRRGAAWSGGAALSALVGTTVVVGHVSDYHDRPGEFHKLDKVKVGQTVVTSGAVTKWRVTKVWLTAKRELPVALFAQGVARKLVLITCGNEIHYPNGHFHYRSNLVIEAIPA